MRPTRPDLSPAPAEGLRPDLGALPIGPDTPWLAPLSGYSDLAFRLVCRERGAAVACTEMISAKGLVYESPGTQALLESCAGDRPLVVQLHGAEAEVMRRAMRPLLEGGARWFDLNAGCPAPKVIRTGCGAAMLKDPDNVLRVARAMIAEAGAGRVGVKLRLGWDREVCLDLARALEQAGAGWITLHPRLGRQGFSGRADWTALARLRRAVQVPVLASGDLATARDGARCLAETGVHGIMFARGALRNPAIFEEFSALLQGRTADEPAPADLLSLIRRHVELARRHDRHGLALLKMRSVIPRYVRGLPQAKALRAEIPRCPSWDALLDLVTEHLTQADAGIPGTTAPAAVSAAC